MVFQMEAGRRIAKGPIARGTFTNCLKKKTRLRFTCVRDPRVWIKGLEHKGFYTTFFAYLTNSGALFII